MSDTKRKTFQFHQEDLDWINPLILEWAEENQDKEKGDLIAELLQDYRQDRDKAAQHKERAQRIQDGADRITDPIRTTIHRLQATLTRAATLLSEKKAALQLDARLTAARTRIHTALNAASASLKGLASDATQRLRELRNPPASS